MRTRASGADATNFYKNWIAHRRSNNQTNEAVLPRTKSQSNAYRFDGLAKFLLMRARNRRRRYKLLQIVTRIGLYINDLISERANSIMACYKLLQNLGLQINDWITKQTRRERTCYNLLQKLALTQNSKSQNPNNKQIQNPNEDKKLNLGGCRVCVLVIWKLEFTSASLCLRSICGRKTRITPRFSLNT